MPKSLSYLPIDLKKDLITCLKFRKDTHYCSFQDLRGFSDQAESNGERYNKYLKSYNPEGLKHIIYNDEIIGQLEFTLLPTNSKIGYINLIYIGQSFRGKGISEKAMVFILEYFLNKSCKEVRLSVSRTNHRAIKYYIKHGFEFLEKNSKDPLVDVYSLKIKPEFNSQL